MVDWSLWTDANLIRQYGLYTLPYGNTYPELAADLRRVLLDKVAGLPFLPAEWASQVRYLYGQDGKILFPAPSTVSGGISFLRNDAQREAWDQMVAMVSAARQPYLDKALSQGRRDMQAAYDNAAFWEQAYQVASVLALPVTAAKAMWNNPWTTGALLYGGLALALYLTLRPRSRR